MSTMYSGRVFLKGTEAMPDLSSRKARGGIMSPNHAVLKVLLFSLAGAAAALLIAAIFN